ncbi:MAG: carboxylesterase family protein [Armatimonadota bacterium]
MDRRRLYATGFSMGASGVWELLGRHPGLFAAAIPVAGYTDTWTAPRLKQTPVWIFHSTRDRIMPVQESRAMTSALRAAACPVRYTEYPRTTHDCWRKALKEPALFAWLFAQRLPDGTTRTTPSSSP